MSGDWHTVTCDDCGFQQVVKHRGYPHNWLIPFNSKGLYEFYCPRCKGNHRPNAGEAVMSAMFAGETFSERVAE